MALPFALLLAMLLALTACADKAAQLRAQFSAGPRIEVVYRQGALTTVVPGTFTTTSNTPEAFRAVADAVRVSLARRMGRIEQRRPPGEQAAARTLQAIVLVNGGYRCTGEAPQFHCTLIMQTQVTFRDKASGHTIGETAIVVGEARYGRHPVRMEEASDRDPDSMFVLRMDRRIKAEIPSTLVLGALLDSTESGLPVFLDELIHAKS